MSIRDLIEEAEENEKKSTSVQGQLAVAEEPRAVFSTGSEFMDNYVVNSVAALQSINQGVPFQDALRFATAEYQSAGVQKTAENAVNSYVADEVQDLVSIAKDTPELQDDAGISAVADTIKETKQLVESETGVQEALVISFNKDLEEQAVKEAAFRDYSAALLGKFMEEQGVLDTVLDFGGLMVPGNYLYSLNELKDIEGLNLEDIDDINFAIRALPVEQRAAILPALISKIQEQTDNSLITAAVVASMTGIGDDVSFDVGVERATLGLTGVAGAVKAVKGLNSIRRLKQIGNEIAAGEHAADLVEEGGISLRQNNLTTPDLQGTVAPFNYEEFFAGATDEISNEIRNSLNRRKAVIDQEIAKVTLSKEGVLRSDEMDKIVQGLDLEIRKSPDVKDVDISFQGDKVTGKILKEDGTEAPFEYALTANDIGSFDGVMKFGTVRSFAAAPSTLFSNIKEGIVEQATLLKDFLTRKNFKNLEDAAKGVFEGLDKKGIKKVDSVLLAGDSYRNGVVRGRVYSPRELTVEGVPTAEGTVRLTPEEAGAYYAARTMFDRMWMIKNHSVRRQLEFEGFKNIALGRHGLAENISELAENAAVKQVDSLPADVAKVFNNNTGRMVDVADVAKDIADGRLVVLRSRDAVRIGKTDEGAEFFEYIVAKADDVTDLPERVLHYQTGYVTRIRQNALITVRSIRDGVVNGVTKANVDRRTERLMDRFDDAEELARQLNEAAEPGVRYEVAPATNLDPRAYENMENINFGGLYTGARSSREIGFGLENVVPERLSAVDSMEQMMAHVAKVGSLNEFKLQAIEKFRKTFGQFLEKPEAWLSPIREGVDPRKAKQIERMRTWLRAQIGMADPAQRFWSSFMHTTAASMERMGFSKTTIGRNIHNNLIAYSSDPFMLGRSLAFNSLLGMWNPAQLLVQATGAAIAFSLNPERFVENFGRTLGLRLGAQLLDAGNTAGLKAMSKRLHKLAGFRNADEYEEAVTGMYNTGLFSSLRSNADYEALKAGMSIDRGAFKRLWDSRLIFFREGEGFTRLYGWSNAYADWKKANPGMRLTQEAANKITKDSLTYTLNLNSANKAIWQDGVLSIPTQFLQISTKYMEALVPEVFGGTSKLSKFKRGQLLLSQFILFGAAGAPVVGDRFAKTIADVWTGGDSNFMTPEEQATFNGGLWGFLSNELIGFGGLDTSRFSISSGLTDMFRALLSDDADVVDAVMGAFGQVPVRLAQAIGYSASVLPAAVYNFDSAALADGVDKFLDITSTWSNASKAYGWYSIGQARDSKGNLLFEVNPEVDMPAILAKGLGLSTFRETSMWKNGQYLYQRDKYLKDITDSYATLLVDFYVRRQDPQAIGTFKVATTILMSDLTPVEKQKIAEAAVRKAFPKDSKEEKQAERILQAILEGDDLYGDLTTPGPIGPFIEEEEQ